jgi:hypothetical protein
MHRQQIGPKRPILPAECGCASHKDPMHGCQIGSKYPILRAKQEKLHPIDASCTSAQAKPSSNRVRLSYSACQIRQAACHWRVTHQCMSQALVEAAGRVGPQALSDRSEAGQRAGDRGRLSEVARVSSPAGTEPAGLLTDSPVCLSCGRRAGRVGQRRRQSVCHVAGLPQAIWHRHQSCGHAWTAFQARKEMGRQAGGLTDRRASRLGAAVCMFDLLTDRPVA